MKGERTRSPSSGGWRVSRQAVCGASRPADRGQMFLSARKTSWPRRAVMTSSSEREITAHANSQAPRARLGPCLAPTPGCRPPERMPPPKAGASRHGERAEQLMITSSSDPIASPAPDTIVKLRGLTPKNAAGPSSGGWRVFATGRLRGVSPRRDGANLPIRAENDWAGVTGSDDAEQCSDCFSDSESRIANSESRTANRESRMVKTPAALHLPIRHLGSWQLLIYRSIF